MPNNSWRKIIILYILVFFPAAWSLAQEGLELSLGSSAKTKVDKAKGSPVKIPPVDDEGLTILQKQARIYRSQGFKFQSLGNLQQALSLYQKAIELDPTYAVAYNDLGVIYEALGELSRAEEHYLQSIRIDPDYLSAYSNLAIFYENARDLKRAAYYWKKRAECGLPQDPWTQKAKARYDDILLVLGEKPVADREQDVVELVKDITQKKLLLKYDEKALAQEYFKNAKLSYQREKYSEALKQATDAQLLDPTNKQISEFIDRLQKRLLSR